MSKRPAQIGAEIHRAIQTVLDRGLQDPRATGALLTVTEVRISDDLRNATILISIMPESRSDLAMHGLRSAAGHIRRQVGNLIAIRQMPQLTFKPDKSGKKQVEVLEAIARAAAERQEAEARAASGEAPPAGWSARPLPPDDEDDRRADDDDPDTGSPTLRA